MKIVALDLRAFGAFTDAALDLSAGQEGLHLIYGPNEAGKSTALRGIEHALFGFPTQLHDDFLHSYKNLRVGAALTTSDGTRLAFLRRKANRGTLLAADNATTLPDSALTPLLGGLDREQFRTLFGIDHCQLVEGGKQIVEGGGSVGEVLFAAGAGIADLQSVYANLHGQAAELYLPKGKKQSINALLRVHDEARKQVKRGQLSAETWQGHERACENARRERAQVDDELRRLRREQQRLERLRHALPLLAQRKDIERQRAALGPTPPLAADFAEKRRTAATALDIACKTVAAAEEELRELDNQIDRIVLPEAILAAAAEIKELPESLGSVRTALRDSLGLDARREQAEQEARRLLRQIRPNVDLAQAESLRLSKPEEAAIRDLGNRHEALEQAWRRSLEEIDELERQLRLEQDEAATLEGQPGVGPLKQMVRRAQQGDLDAAAAAQREAAARMQRQAEVALARLAGWSGSLAELERLPVPGDETINRFEQELAELDRRLRTCCERQAGVAGELEDTARQIDQLRREGDVPTEADLEAARRDRDQGWRLIRQRLESGAADARAEEQEFLARVHPGAALADAYEAAVAKADQLADRLRRETQRAAQLAGCLAQRDSLSRRAAALAEECSRLDAERQTADSQWRACWQPTGVAPQSPREMRGWLQAWRDLARQGENLRSAQTAWEETQRRLHSLAAEIRGALADVGETAGDAEGLSALLARSQTLVDRVETAAARREQLGRSAGQLRDKLQAAQRRAMSADSALAEWRERWARSLEPLGLSADAPPVAANALLEQLADLFRLIGTGQELGRRIADIHRNSDQFAQRVNDLARRVAPAVADKPFDQAAAAMIAELQAAHSTRERREFLDRQRSSVRRQRSEAQAAIDAYGAQLAVLLQEAGCERVEDLPQAEAAAAAARDLDRRLNEVREQLIRDAAGGSLEDLTAEAEGMTADALPDELQQIAVQVDTREARRGELERTVGGEEAQLAALRAAGGAAEAAQEEQDALARLEFETLQYVRLRLAAAVLREGIERYREKNEEPVLRRASDLFSRFTLGRFDRLVVEDDDKGQKTLKGTRSAGPPGLPKTIELAAMSEGTADQLFLALRLASVENRLDGRESIPLVLDDILIRFDDERAAAALTALAELSCKTQILFFTHHEHLVELARRTLSPEVLLVHRL